MSTRKPYILLFSIFLLTSCGQKTEMNSNQWASNSGTTISSHTGINIPAEVQAGMKTGVLIGIPPPPVPTTARPPLSPSEQTIIDAIKKATGTGWISSFDCNKYQWRDRHFCRIEKRMPR